MRVHRILSSLVGGGAEAAAPPLPRAAAFDLRSAFVRYRTWVALLPLAIFAFALRSHGADFGLPHLYYWDEPTVVNRAIRFGSGDLNPHFFVYPALYMYAIFGLSGAYFVAGFLVGEFSSVTDFAGRYFVDPSGVYLSARLLTAAIGTATVVMVFFAGRKYFGELVGYLGAVFLAVSVLHASHSHIAVADVPQSLLIVAAYVPLHDVAVKGRRRDYVLAGLLIGAGIAVKYVAALLLPVLIAAHLMNGLGGRDSTAMRPRLRAAFSSNFFLALCFVIVAFFAGSPFNFLDFHAFLDDWREQSAISAGEGGTSLGYFLLDVLPADLGWPLYAAALVGMVLIAVRHRRTDVLFLIFPVVYFLFFARYDRVFARYMIQEDPFLALMAAYAVIAAFTWLRERRQRLAYGLTACLVLVLIAPPAYANARWNVMMATQPDTRTEALRWANATIPDGTLVAVQPLFDRTYYNAPLQTDRSVAAMIADIPSGPRFDAVRSAVLAELDARPKFTEVEFTYDLEALRRSGVRYVFISDQNWSQQVPASVPGSAALPSTEPLSDEERFALDLGRDAELVAVFEAEDVPGMSKAVLPIQPPTISVYEIRQAGTGGEGDRRR